jgi:hypothetical protein
MAEPVERRFRGVSEAARGECAGALMRAHGGEEATRERKGRRDGGAVWPAR